MEMIVMSAENNTAMIPEDVVAEEFYIALQRAYRAMREAFLTRRQKSDINQQVIADRLGWDKALVSRRLHGRANLTFKTMSALATAMDCRLNVEFMEYDDMRVPNYHYDEADIEEQTSSTVTLPKQNQSSVEEGTAATPRPYRSLKIIPVTRVAV
jgi:transcriptional regulator with XRE-family HTH domain